MSGNPRNNRKPLQDVQNVPPRTTTGIKRTVPSTGDVEPASKRKSAIPVSAASRARRDTISRLGSGAGRDNVSQGSQRTGMRRQTEAGTRSQTSSYRSATDSQSQATTRTGRIRPAMTFTASSATKPRTLSRPNLATSKSVEKDDETARRLTNQEIKSKTLESQVEALVKLVQAVPNNQTAAAELSELRSRLSMTEMKLQAAEKEVIEKTNLILKAEMEVKMKDMAFMTKQSEMERSIAEQKGKADGGQNELNEMRKELEQSKDRIRDLEVSLQSRETEVVALNAESSTFASKISNLEETLSKERSLVSDLQRFLQRAQEAEKLAEKRMEDLHSETSKQRKNSEHLQELQSKLQEELANLKTKLNDTLTSCDSEMKERQRLLEENSNMKASYEETLVSQKQKFDQIELSMASKLDGLIGSSNLLQQRLSSANSELDAVKSSFSAQTKAMALLQEDKNVLAIQKESIENESARKQKALEQLQAELVEKNRLIEELEEQAREDQRVRRKLHNAVQELKGNIRVFCRVRPFLKGESADREAEPSIAYTDKSKGIALTQPEANKRSSSDSPQNWNFKFDHVFGPQCAQDQVFTEISELVQSALDGYRVSIFAYGQTGSGKTHTMLGGSGDELGMIPRSVQQVFETADNLSKDQWTFTFRAAFLEIYNETVRDLLIRPSGGKEKPLPIKFNTETRESEVNGLTIENVDTPEKILALIQRSQRNRATASTQANERSSRSHSVFRLYIDGHNSLSGQKLKGLLNLVDLAGSERLNMSKAKGERLKETQHINKSLSSLGDVIAALANKEKHIPFRNSKLTFLLQDSLGGDSKTLMFVNVSPVLTSFNESLCSLRFAAKVNACDIGTARKTTKIEF